MSNSNNYPLESKGLILRLPEINDTEAMQAIISAWDVAVTTLTIPYPYTVEMAKEWIQAVHQRDDESSFRYVIIRKSDNQLVGGCGFQVSSQHEKAEIGYWIGVPYWGNGYATETVRTVIQFCFEDLGLNRVEAEYFAENGASRRVMEKAGMTFEGLARQSLIREILSKNHRVYHDIGSCAILRDDWKNAKG